LLHPKLLISRGSPSHRSRFFSLPLAYPGFFSKGWGISTNSVEDRGQRERGSGGGSPLIRGSAQFSIRFDFVKPSGCRGLLRMYLPPNRQFGPPCTNHRDFGGGGFEHPNPPPYATVQYRIAVSGKEGPNKYIVEAKAIPLQPWTGPEGSRSLGLPDFKTIGTRRW
jgi:hypothetical protein